MTASPRCTSSRQSGRRRLALDDRRQASGDRLDRRERVVHLVPDDANQALPRLPFFLAQRLAQIGEHQQLVRPAALAEQASPDFPPAHATGKRGGDDARRLAAQALVEIELGGAPPEEPFRRLTQESRAGAVHELELVFLVEGEDRDVDLRHHFPQEGRGLERVEPLMAQRFDQGVDLDHDLAERVTAARAAGAYREVPLAERGQQVRERLQRQHHPLAQCQCEAQAEGDDEDRQRPLDLRGVVAGPQKDERDERPRQRRGERHQEDAAVVAEARLAGRGGGHGSGLRLRLIGSRQEHRRSYSNGFARALSPEPAEP